MLDSGASCASLSTSDLKELGIIKKNYSAQCYASFNLANGAYMKHRVFEMYVEVDGNEGTPIIDPNNPMVLIRRVIGGIYPVLEIQERIKDPFNAESYIVINRLSGIVPFLSSYISMVPGNNIMLLGENRNDALGHYKMPRFQVWDFYGSQASYIKPDSSFLDNPILHFHHPVRQITEKDYSPSVVETTRTDRPMRWFH